MVTKTRVAAALLVLCHAVSAQSDALHRVAITKLFHQIPARSVRQSQVADDDIEALRRRELQRLRYAASTLDIVIQRAQQVGQQFPRILMILDKQDADVSIDAAMVVSANLDGFVTDCRREL